MFTKDEKDGFFEAVESLKKYRRADIIDDDGRSLLQELYTDLLPNEHILNKVLKDNTTFLIGRKGTGKSTIFLRLEQEINKKSQYLSCYLDVKTIFESSQTEYTEISYLKEYFPEGLLKKYLIERTFLQHVLKSMKEEISKKTSNLFDRFTDLFGNNKRETVRENLSELELNINNNEILRKIEIPILQQEGFKRETIKEKQKESGFDINNPNIKLNLGNNNLGLKLNSNFGLTAKKNTKESNDITANFSKVFLQVFQIKEIILKIKEILKLLNIRHLIVMLDDFSEIEEDSIKTFVDVILAPLNNWSEEFIKFKIAAYPHRVYYGKIDPGKIDKIDLDFYNLYSEFNRDEMEENAYNFTNRILSKRLKYYTNSRPEKYFEVSNQGIDEYYKLLFQVSMNVPRILGYILSYCYQRKIIFEKQITKSDIEQASQSYYEEKMESFFDTTTYSLISIGEKISILQLKELLEEFCEKLSGIKKRIQTKNLKGTIYLPNYPYSSHFHFDPRFEKFLKTLELNFFISKYNELSDKDGKPVSIYSIYYGLVKKLNLFWGKPEGTKYRKYFIERPFNFTRIIHSFLQRSKRIYCINPACNKQFPIEQLSFLEFNKMKCNECGNDVTIESISDEIKSKLETIGNNRLLPIEEITILKELDHIDKFAFARDIAEELDLSKYLIAFRAKKLAINYNYIQRMKEKEGEPYKYRITEEGKNYFNDFI